MSAVALLAWRNVCRHPRRTGMTAGAVAAGVTFVVVALGFLDSTFAGLRHSIVYGGLGHLQIRARGIKGSLRLRPGQVEALRHDLSERSEVVRTAVRLPFQGLASHRNATVAVSGIGVEPSAEAALRSLTPVLDGEWFSGAEAMAHVLVGSGLAEALDAHPGDLVAILSYSDGGIMTAADLRIAGVFESGVVEVDTRTMLLPVATAHELVETQGVDHLVVELRAGANSRAIADRLAAAYPALHVETWERLAPLYASVVKLYRWVLGVFLAIILLVVILGIANTMSMAVFERIPEIGILLALGFGRGHVLAMFLCEAICIAAVGACVGVLMGSAACVGLSHLGLEMPPPPGRSVGYLAAVNVVPSALVGSAGLAIVAALVGGVGPALRAVRIEVSHALRTI